MGNLDVFATDKTLGNYRVCMVECDDDTVSEQDVMANAHLIAAAPDLLAVLEEAYQYMVDYKKCQNQGLLDDMQAAITKAREIPDK